MSLIGLLLVVIVIGFIIWATRALMAAFAVSEPIATVIYVFVALLCLVWLLGQFGVLSSGPVLRVH